MQLRFATWPEVERYLEQRDDILIPIGATEQHGPIGLLGTDALCAEGVANTAGERAGILVAPVLSVGMSMHHLAFPGTISLLPSTMIAVLEDWCGSLAAHGFRRLHFVNGHGGNIATSHAAFSEIFASHPQLRCRLSNWYELGAVKELVQEHIGEREGLHATPSELSLSFALHPDHARETEPQQPTTGIIGMSGAEDFRAQFPDGRVGSDQSLASVALGGELLETAVAGLLEVHSEWLATMA